MEILIELIVSNGYLRFLSIFLISVVLALVVNYLMRTYAKNVAAKTKSPVDDEILKAVMFPVFISIIFWGFYVASTTFEALQAYFKAINNGFFIFYTVMFCVFFSRIIEIFVNNWLKVRRGIEKTPRLLRNILVTLLYVIATLVVLRRFNISITPFLTTLGISGIVLGLALQNTFVNFFAGIHLVADKPIRVGDFIEVDGGVSGYVMDIGWRSTRIMKTSNNVIIIPNSKIAESVITNDSLPDSKLSVIVECSVSYKSDLKKVEKTVLEVAKKIQNSVQGAVKDYLPSMSYSSFGDYGIKFVVVFQAERFSDRSAITHECIKALKERFDKEKIELSIPVRRIIR